MKRERERERERERARERERERNNDIRWEIEVASGIMCTGRLHYWCALIGYTVEVLE